MNKNSKRWAAAACCWLISQGLAAAQNTGAAFLRVDTGARPAALGGAYTAIADDVHSLQYNPAGLSSIKKREVGLTHTEWILGSKFDFIGYAQPTSHGTFGLGMTRLASGRIEGRDTQRRDIGSFQASHAAYTVGFGRAVPTTWGAAHLGGNVKFLESRIGADSASTFALDMGASHRLSKVPLSLGISVMNLGKGMKFLEQTDPLPLTVALGVGYRLGGLLNLSSEIRRDVHDQRTEIGMGTEYAILSALTIRAGYASHLAQANGGAPALGGFGGGVGLKLFRYQVDYTFMPYGILGNVQRISFGARF